MLNDTLFYGIPVMTSTVQHDVVFNFTRSNPVYSNPILAVPSAPIQPPSSSVFYPTNTPVVEATIMK